MTDNSTIILSSSVDIQPYRNYLSHTSSAQSQMADIEELMFKPCEKLSSFRTDAFDFDKIIFPSISIIGDSDTSILEKIRTSLEVEKNALEYVAQSTQEEKQQQLKKFANELVAKLRFYSYDDDSMNPIWFVSDRILEQTSMSILGEVFQSIYLEYNDYPNILCGICRILASFDLHEVQPWGPFILIGMLNHQNETVKEYAVILLDNWKDKNLIPVLRNLDCHAQWLKAYIREVLDSMEE